MSINTLKWLENFSSEIESDPDVIDSMPIEDVHKELEALGVNRKKFHLKLKATLLKYKLIEILRSIFLNETARLIPGYELDEEEKNIDTNLFKVKSIIPAAGRRDGESVILPDDNSESVTELKQTVAKMLKAGTSPLDYPIHILTCDNNEKWYLYKEIERLEIPVKIQDSDNNRNRFVLLIDSQDCISVSSEALIELLNTGKTDKQVFATTVAVVIDIPQTTRS